MSTFIWLLFNYQIRLLLIDFIMLKLINEKFKFCNTWNYKFVKILYENDMNFTVRKWYEFRTTKDWPILTQSFCFPVSFFYISHSIDICMVLIKNIRNMHAISTNHTQIFYILKINESKGCQHYMLNPAQILQFC